MTHNHIQNQYRNTVSYRLGCFNWKLEYIEIPLNAISLENRRLDSEPFRSYILATGNFAISAQFFKELNYYDDGLRIWGGEQFELSFKAWMCGGEILRVPCSRIGQIQKLLSNAEPTAKEHLINYNRIVDVWWSSDHQKEFRQLEPDWIHYESKDILIQKYFREKCHSFEWFLQRVVGQD